MLQVGVMANTHPAPGTDLTRMVDEVIAEAQQAERCGFDSFFLTEHHQEPSGYFPSPLPLAPEITVSHASLLVADQVQPGAEPTTTDPDPPEAGTGWLCGDRLNSHCVPDCVTRTFTAFSVIWPDRLVIAGFAEA